MEGDITSALNGVRTLGEFIMTIESNLYGCQSVVYDQITSLWDAAAILKEPKSLIFVLGTNISLNGVPIWKEIQNFSKPEDSDYCGC